MRVARVLKTLSVPDELPEWFTLTKSDSLFTAGDLLQLFGISRSTFDRREFPLPDKVERRRHSSGIIRYWYKATVVTEIERLRSIAEVQS